MNRVTTWRETLLQGAFYLPDGDRIRLASLDVHEHWNNPGDKKYSGNL